MIDRLFTLTLTFAILAGATLAVGDEFFSTQPGQPAPIVAELPRVVITGEVQPASTALASAESNPESSAESSQKGNATARVQ